MKNKTKIHDGIVGSMIFLSIVLAVKVNMAWLWLAGIISVLMISTVFTSFCLVYFIINKLMPEGSEEKQGVAP